LRIWCEFCDLNPARSGFPSFSSSCENLWIWELALRPLH
jgi:hypothetical protein